MSHTVFHNSLQEAREEEVSTAKAFGDALLKMGGRYKNAVVLDAHYGRNVHVGGFVRAFPDRYFNFGNAESNMIDAATGFAARGKIPMLCSFGMFLTGRAWEQIRNSLCHSFLNVKLIGGHAGLLAAEDGASYQALEDVALMRAIPNMKIICPADAVETKSALEAMMNDFGPTYLRLTQKPLPIIYDSNYKFELGRGSIYKPGTDVCIFAYGPTVHTSLRAADLLERDGISTMVVNISSLKPIDESLVVECAKQAQRVVTVEDHQVVGGLGSAVCEILSTYYPMKVLRLGMDGFGEVGKVTDLYLKYGLDGQGIYEAILAP